LRRVLYRSREDDSESPQRCRKCENIQAYKFPDIACMRKKGRTRRITFSMKINGKRRYDKKDQTQRQTDTIITFWHDKQTFFEPLPNITENISHLLVTLSIKRHHGFHFKYIQTE